jgi:hypothetical protein
LFSPLQPFQRDQKEFKDVRGNQAQLQQKDTNTIVPSSTSKEQLSQHQQIFPMENNIKLMKNRLFSSLDRRTIVSTAGTSLLAVLTVYSLMKTGKLAAIANHASWWIQNAFFTYQNALVNDPLRTKVGTGAVLAILGDALAQSTTGYDTTYDKRRALSFAVFDSCYRVFQHYMFPAVIALCQGNVVSKILPAAVPTVSAAVERTLLYQLVVVPVSNSVN